MPGGMGVGGPEPAAAGGLVCAGGTRFGRFPQFLRSCWRDRVLAYRYRGLDIRGDPSGTERRLLTVVLRGIAPKAKFSFRLLVFNTKTPHN